MTLAGIGSLLPITATWALCTQDEATATTNILQRLYYAINSVDIQQMNIAQQEFDYLFYNLSPECQEVIIKEGITGRPLQFVCPTTDKCYPQ